MKNIYKMDTILLIDTNHDKMERVKDFLKSIDISFKFLNKNEAENISIKQKYNEGLKEIENGATIEISSKDFDDFFKLK